MALITLPLPENRANSSWHWRVEKRKRDAYMLRATVMHPNRPLEPLTRASVHAVLYLHQIMDEDNLTARLKWPLDWLVHREFIVDDSPKVLTSVTVEQIVDRKNQRIELTVSDAQNLWTERGA